jgi:hypothetical protein
MTVDAVFAILLDRSSLLPLESIRVGGLRTTRHRADDLGWGRLPDTLGLESREAGRRHEEAQSPRHDARAGDGPTNVGDHVKSLLFDGEPGSIKQMMEVLRVNEWLTHPRCVSGTSRLFLLR